MRLWLLLILVALLSMVSVPQTESHSFNLHYQPHEMLLQGQPAYSYGTTWSVEIPAPTSRPLDVDLRELSVYVYKYIVYNIGLQRFEGEFVDPTWSTSFKLEGVDLGTFVHDLDNMHFFLDKFEYYWGPDRPKITKRVDGALSVSGEWPDPAGSDTWTLEVTCVSHFDFWASGPGIMGQSMRQKVRGSVTYRY